MKTLLLLLATLLLPTASLAAAPQLQAEAPIFNFGRIAEGSKIDHTFRFQNSGDAPLVINKVRSSCGCTAALLSADRLAPGEWGELKTTFDSRGFQGKINKTIYIHSNDPGPQPTRFRLQGEVLKELVVQPSRLRFRAGHRQPPFKATINLRNGGQTPLFLSNLKTTSEELQAKLSASQLAPGQSVQIAITLTQPVGKSRFAGYVTLRTSSARTPTVRIPVTAVFARDAK